MPQSPTPLALFLTAALALAGCKILPTPAEDAGAAPGAFDPDRMAAEMWDSKVLPYLRNKAGPLAEVQALATTDPKAAGERYGNPEKQANSPWTFAARIEGTVVAADTQSRAATLDVDANADGQADARVQIGPALRGTALRDSLDFVDFNQFTNQIDFAQFGKSLNTHVNRTVLEKLPREDLVGRPVAVLGAYAAASGAGLPLVTPATVEIGPKL